MTIEEALARSALNLGRIADALEALVNSQGIVPGTKVTVEEIEPEPEKKPASNKKATKKKASKKKASKKQTVGKKEEEAEVTLTIKDDVRPVLKRLREDKSHAAVKSLLKTYGASTLQQLEEKNFANVIADALEQLGEEVQDELDLDDDL
jgi:phytoene dehydrogenase-like protein